MTADVCDLDELKSGLRREGILAQFIGGWSSLVL
jgi:Na+/melibiose symporter-like transporter